MQRSIRFIAFLLLGSITLAAQTKAPAVKSPSLSRSIPAGTPSSDKRWEYLVVSFDKTVFTDPTDSPEIKAGGLSKLVQYSRAGVTSASEALSTENQMDLLGKFGWELVDILGAIGGDQQMVFRRASDPERSAHEAALIKEEGERLIALQKEAAAQLARSEDNKTELVDVDAVEKAAATQEVRRKEEARLTQAVNSLTNYPVARISVTSIAATPTDSSVRAEVVIDGTAVLVTGNKYRSSEANRLAKRIAETIYHAAGLSRDWYSNSSLSSSSYYLGEVKLAVLISVSFDGTTKTIATELIGGKWQERAEKRP
ncbi:MAG TPA: hypothetical protein VN622_05900 [Clostridia bacterium]|nr:hypothetical protein [Clostridia bacterium]